MSENVNLSLLEKCFESSSLANYAKVLINIKDLDKNREIVEETTDNVRFKRENNNNNKKKLVKQKGK